MEVKSSTTSTPAPQGDDAAKAATEKATPTAPPTTESGATAAASKDTVKSKTDEKKSEVGCLKTVLYGTSYMFYFYSQSSSTRLNFFDMDDDDEDPEEMDRLERERQQRSTRNLYSHARTVRRCMQYATKVLDRYEVN